MVSLILGLGMANGETTYGAEIQWTGSVAQAQQQWNTAAKPLLVYVTTDACFYCRKLDQTTWMDDSVGNLVNDQFVKLKVDGRRNQAIVAQLSVRAFPTIIVFSADGQLLGRREGMVQPSAMLDFLREMTHPTGLVQ